MEPEFNESKFGELIVYIAWTCDDDPFLGATKLNKLLFYSDFEAYRLTGRAITGEEYRGLDHGPAPRHLVSIRKRLIKQGAIALKQRGPQHRIVALRSAKLDVFLATEIDIVHKVLDHFTEYDTADIEEKSHAFVGWLAARAESLASGRMVPIPYSTVFVSRRRLDEFDRARLIEIGKQQGWFEEKGTLVRTT